MCRCNTLTRVADIAGLIVGSIGTAAGIAALIYAHVANRNARESTRIANDSKGLAEVANELARESNTIATDARQLAEEANQISHRGEARDTERHDVHWDGDWKQPGVYILTKLGNDQARDVRATVTYDGERVIQTAELMANEGDHLAFQFPTAVADFRREVAEHIRHKQQSDAYAISGLWGAHPHRVEERVEWTTPQGTPKLHEDTAPLTVFDGFYPD